MDPTVAEPAPATFRIQTDGVPIRSHGRYGAGEQEAASAADGRMRERIHACTCLAVVVSGRFDFRTPVGAATATPGSMIFGHAGEPFTFRYLDCRGARRSVIGLSEELLGEVAEACGTHRFPVAAIAPQRRTTALYAMTRKVALDGGSESDVYEVVAAALSAGRESSRRMRAPRENNRVRDIARQIDADYARPWSLAQLAAMAQLSRFHFLRVFKTQIGESPAQYVVAARLRAAAGRLLATREPIASIALDVGFNDLSHFNATFRATFGTPPSTFRRGCRNPLLPVP
jgi:AraC-like DNA-binding protein